MIFSLDVRRARKGDCLLLHFGTPKEPGLVMIDGTTFNLTANARLMMNDLTYDATSTSNTSLFTLVQGAASFVAGQVAKTGDMKVGTPVATMGIRGTAPHVEISEDGTVHFATLAEEGVTQPGQPNKPGTPAQDNKRAAPAPQNKPAPPADQRQRQAKNASSGATEQAMADQNKRLKNLSICRGC